VTLTAIPANQVPVAAFTYSPTSPGAGTPVQFDASPSADPDGTVISYAWNFGDTGTAVGPVVSHTYAASGSYTVQLTVTDNGGATGQVSRSVDVASSDDVGWVSPVSFEDPSHSWGTTQRLAYDRKADTFAMRQIAPNDWSSFLVFTLGGGGVRSDRVRLLLDRQLNLRAIEWDVDVEVGGAWIDVYSGAPEGDRKAWFVIPFAEALVTRARVRAHNLSPQIGFRAAIGEIQLRDVTVPLP
jgi:hypothetical protein